MKNKKPLTAAAILIALALTLTAVVFAASYDSSEDPFISLSGLNLILEERLSALETKLTAAFQQKLDAVGSPGQSQTAPETAAPAETQSPADTEAPSDAQNTAGSAYNVVYAQKGAKIMSGDACEVILRAGECAAVSPFADQGLSDLTDASELLDGDKLTKNHLLLIPRGDGRGVEVVSDSAYIMIRGVYTIVEP